MDLSPGVRLLRGRYELLEGPFGDAAAEESAAQAWLAIGEYGSEYLVKTWSHDEQNPDTSYVHRALWDAELRTLYRACSSPGADLALMMLREAGVDRENKCLVMVLEAPGYVTLASQLGDGRPGYPWLSNQDGEARKELWTALRSIADGLNLLHEQQVLHTSVSAESVFFDPVAGADSMRLGGFEWSMRVGSDAMRRTPPHWGTPPEAMGAGIQAFSPDNDWFGFGMLAVRCLLSIEHLNRNDPRPMERYRQVLHQFDGARRQLSELEGDFLRRLLAEAPLDRMTRYEDILATINDIIIALGTGIGEEESSGRYVLMVDPRNAAVCDAAINAGLGKQLGLGLTSLFNPQDDIHVTGLLSFIQNDLNVQGARLYGVRNQQYMILVGDRLQFRIGPYRDVAARETEPTWRNARCIGVAELRGVTEGAHTMFSQGSISVHRIRSNPRFTDRNPFLNALSWERKLPRADRVAERRAALERFCEFIRVTNQIELLIRDAELYPYEIIERTIGDGKEEIVIREAERARQVLPFLEMESGLAEFLQREKEASTKPDSGLVILTDLDHDSLNAPLEGSYSTWEVALADVEARTARLVRSAVGNDLVSPPECGILRNAGMDGQIKLIRRRRDAIDRLARHTYLLRSLANPGEVYMDTGQTSLPVPLDDAKVDAAKRAVIEDVLRIRPIYALQGPPGTGKTTMVAWLLREILEDDPVAQILVTAQAHGAVDVLWAKVRDEAFGAVADERRPLAIRLGRKADVGEADAEGSADDVTRHLLESAISRLQSLSERSAIQEEWLSACTDMLKELGTGQHGASLPDFRQLVKRSANLTFSTTSAGELEGLSSELSFDWTIVEEAGKVHGFDLALPLQAGHRWLLIGDHKQLPPYKDQDYHDAVDHLGHVVDALDQLPNAAAGLLDRDFIRAWRDRSSDEQRDFILYCKHWLKVFEAIFVNCSFAVGGRAEDRRMLTGDTAEGAAAGMLSMQHRMHPNIGTLISEAYYDNDLTNETLDESGNPLPRVTHHFTTPSEIAGKAIVWLDTPWSAAGDDAGEWGPARNVPRFINPAEAYALTRFLSQLRTQTESDFDNPLELAVLSPYTQQVGYLQRQLRNFSLPPGVRFAGRSRQRAGDPIPGAFTVDSFQGNQADIIAVSLVRNNKDAGKDRGRNMGFLRDARRLNVLLSRAERLLVLVGSWEFFEYQTELVQLNHFDRELWHWKRVLTSVSEWLDEGRAVRIPADLAGYQQPSVRNVLGSRPGGSRP